MLVMKEFKGIYFANFLDIGQFSYQGCSDILLIISVGKVAPHPAGIKKFDVDDVTQG